MTAVAVRETPDIVLRDDPTGGRLIAWAQAASAANALAKSLCKTTFIPAAFQGKENEATAAILMGDELGLSPIAALRSIYLVHGTPAMYARAMVALALAHGHEVWTEKSTDTEVIVHGRRKGTDHIEKSLWTIARARQAGYTNNKKYQSNPQEMLYAKAAAEIARKVAADVLAGVPYSVEDLELGDEAPTTRKAASTRTRRAEIASVPEPDLDDPSTPETPATEPPLDDADVQAQADYEAEQARQPGGLFGGDPQ